MNDRALASLARKAGLSPEWIDAHGRKKTVSPDTLRTVLTALGHEAGSAAAIAGSLRVIKAEGPARPMIKDAPRRAYAMASDHKLWATAVPLYSLRGKTAIDFGDFAALGDCAEQATAQGADGIAISPVHALFGARPSHISPYSPSTRLFLNPLYVSAEEGRKRVNDATLIDWPSAHAHKMKALKNVFDKFDSDADTKEFEAFVRGGGERLLAHARFEVLDARFVVQGIYGWRNWPASWRDANSKAVRALDAADDDVRFQLFLQWLAETGLAGAQTRARAAGMKIGLIVDMAVGVDPDGSLAWSSPGEMLEGLNIGAPPDIFNAAGQNWGLTTFSPRGLRASGYSGFVATLRAAMRHAGAMRLDHAMGLRRLWVVPRGASAADGVYLDYPMRDMMRLIARESLAHKCLVIAEDLGTVPTGFRDELARTAVYGMQVLWFERGPENTFLAPAKWRASATALSTTHDLPTIAGWWTGRDIAWRKKIGASTAATKTAKRERKIDKKLLWRALKSARCTKGAMPAVPDPVIAATLAFLGKTPCPLAIVPAEDFLGLREQPNLPGTIDQHPNWRRRFRTANIFSGKAARARANILTKSRKS